MSELTMNNINSVRAQIARKIDYNRPYYADPPATHGVITDMDHFPYKRYFRGVYYESHPVVMEREAGFRPRRDSCYTQISLPKPNHPNYCWEYPCSTVKPCKKYKADAAHCGNNCVNNFVVPP